MTIENRNTSRSSREQNWPLDGTSSRDRSVAFGLSYILCQRVMRPREPFIRSRWYSDLPLKAEEVDSLIEYVRGARRRAVNMGLVLDGLLGQYSERLAQVAAFPDAFIKVGEKAVAGEIRTAIEVVSDYVDQDTLDRIAEMTPAYAPILNEIVGPVGR